MYTKDLFTYTLRLSVYIQFITLILGLLVSVKTIPTEYILIKELFFLELFVQIIEGLFYIWLVYNFSKVSNITPRRYIDWIITTPTMLITLISYLIFLKAKESNQTHNLNLISIMQTNYKTIIPILFLNWLMMLFGYLGEIKVLSIIYSVFLGFIPFIIYFYMIYINYVSEKNSGYVFYIYFLFFWSLYGVAAILPYYVKNTLYNILDLFAKNFFGIFLAYIIYTGNY
jgi:hypothetical protein